MEPLEDRRLLSLFGPPIKTTLNLPSQVNVVAVGDFNGDGLTDVARLDDSNPRKVQLFASDGKGGFTQFAQVDSTRSGYFIPHLLAAGHFTGAATDDLALISDVYLDPATQRPVDTPTRLSIWSADGKGGMQESASIDVAADFAATIVVGDFDHSGHDELAVEYHNPAFDVTHPHEYVVAVYKVDAKGGLGALGSTLLIDDTNTLVAPGHFHGGTDEDLLVQTITLSPDRYVQDVFPRVLRNDGHGTFVLQPGDKASLNGTAVTAAVGDFFGTGVDGVVGSFTGLVDGQTKTTMVLLQTSNGDGTFTATPLDSGVGVLPVVADFNGDKHLDLLRLSGYFQNSSLEVLKGDGHGGFAPFKDSIVDTGSAFLNDIVSGHFTGGEKPDLLVWDHFGGPGPDGYLHGGPGPATLLVNQFPDLPDNIHEREPNTSLATATAFPDDSDDYTVPKGVLLSANDTDYYKLNVTAGRAIHVGAAPTNTSAPDDKQVRPLLTLYDPDGKPVKSGDGTVDYDIFTAGTWFISVTDGERSGPYVLSVHLVNLPAPPIDLGSLQIIADQGTAAYNFQLKRYEALNTKVFFGQRPQDGEAFVPLLMVDGSVWVDQTTIHAEGTTVLNVDGFATELFTGAWDIPVGQLQTSSLNLGSNAPAEPVAGGARRFKVASLQDVSIPTVPNIPSNLIPTLLAPVSLPPNFISNGIAQGLASSPIPITPGDVNTAIGVIAFGTGGLGVGVGTLNNPLPGPLQVFQPFLNTAGNALTRTAFVLPGQLSFQVTGLAFVTPLNILGGGPSLQSSYLQLQGVATLDPNLTVGNGQRVDLGGTQIAIGGQDSVKIDGAGKVSVTGGTINVPDGVHNFLGVVNATSMDLMATFDTAADDIRIQGSVTLTDLYNTVLNFTGDSYIDIHDGIIKVVGRPGADQIVINYEQPIFQTGLAVGVTLRLRDVQFTIDTHKQLVTGRAFLTVGNLPEVGVGVTFKNGNLDFLTVDVPGPLNVPLILPLFFIQNIRGTWANVAKDSPLVPQFSGRLGMTIGPLFDLPLPDFLGGARKGALVNLNLNGTWDAIQMDLGGRVSLFGGLITGATAAVTMKWTYPSAIKVEGGLDFLDGIISTSGSFSLDSNLNLTLARDASLKLPNIPGTPIQGQTIAAASVYFVYLNDANLHDSYIEGYGTLNTGLGTYKVGLRVRLDLSVEPMFDKVDPVGQTFTIAAGTQHFLLAAGWQNAAGRAVPVEIVDPNGRVYTEADFDNVNIGVVNELSGSTFKAVGLVNPIAGDWTINLPDQTGLGTVEFHGYHDIDAPTVKVTSLVHDGADVIVNYEAHDANAHPHVALYYDAQNTGNSGRIFAHDLAGDGMGRFVWHTQGLPPGAYYVYAVIEDDNNPPVFAYSDSPVTIVDVAPVLAALDNLTALEGQPLTFTAKGNDVNGQTLIYSLGGTVPTGAHLDQITGAFTWTPTEAQAPGSYLLTLTVKELDGDNLSDTKSFTIDVKEVNESPKLAFIGNKVADVGQLLQFTATATDPDGAKETLTYRLDAGSPTGATIDPTSGAFTWTPASTDSGTAFSITVRVTDNGAGNLSATRTFAVLVNRMNRPPALAPLPYVTAHAGEVVHAKASATDPNGPGHTLTYHLDAGAPTGASIDAQTGAFAWTPPASQAPGVYHAIVRAITDNGSSQRSDIQTLNVNVLPGVASPSPVSGSPTDVGSPAPGGGGTTVPPPPVAPLGVIRGTVFVDANNDGLQDDGESGIAGVQVNLDAINNGRADASGTTTLTGADGSYTFSKLADGTYRVRENALLAVATVPADGTADVTLAEGSQQQVNFGLIKINIGVPVPAPRKINTPPTLKAEKDADIHAFVRGLYHSVLDRDIEARGEPLTYWVNVHELVRTHPEALGLPAGTDPYLYVSQGFWTSEEHRWREVEKYYHHFMGRDLDLTNPRDVEGRHYWTFQFMSAGAVEADVIRGFLTAPEFLFGHRADAALAATLNAAVLDGMATAADLRTWNAALAALDAKRAALKMQVFATAEAYKSQLAGDLGALSDDKAKKGVLFDALQSDGYRQRALDSFHSAFLYHAASVAGKQKLLEQRDVSGQPLDLGTLAEQLLASTPYRQNAAAGEA